MKKAIFCIGLLLCGCGHSGNPGGSSNVVAVNGTDMSGVYIAHSVQCYNSALTTMTNASTYSGAFAETQTINGSDYTGIVSDGTCSVTTSGTIEFSNDSISISNLVVLGATGGSCTIDETLNGSNISPATVSKTYSTGESLGDINDVPYVQFQGGFGLETIYTDGSGGYCFLMLEKQ